VGNGLWPSKCASNVGVRAIYVQIRVVFTWLKLYFKVPVLIFYVCEGLSQPIANSKHAKIMVLIFLTMKATIFDALTVFTTTTTKAVTQEHILLHIHPPISDGTIKLLLIY